MQEADNLAMRHSQQLDTGKLIQVYSADMRRAVSLQFYPDGYELVEAEPTLISEGYSSHKASHCLHSTTSGNKCSVQLLTTILWLMDSRPILAGLG